MLLDEVIAQNPPEDVERRRIPVQKDRLNTVEVPCDPRDPNFARWFDTGPGMHQIWHNNEVKELIDGVECFASMARAIELATSSDDYIYLLAWFADLTIELDPTHSPVGGAASTRIIDYLTNAVSRGVQVRAMFWDQVGRQNSAEVTTINRIPSHPTIPGANGAAILDDNTLNFAPLGIVGSHHQKILIVKGGERLVTFCGGVDPNLDRIRNVAGTGTASSGQAGSPMHDVHCRIEGPASVDILNIFVERWNDHPSSPALDASKGALRGNHSPTLVGRGDKHVQIGKTYGNGTAHRGIRNKFGGRNYTFAPTGERTARAMIFHAIRQAQRFIYCEDQYLVDMDASNELKSRLPAIQKLIILIPHPSINTHPWIWTMCKRFVDNLGYPANRKVSVCYLKRAGDPPSPRALPSTRIPHTYVHAKMWVFDDKYAIIGSANCGRRSYTHDSEAVAGIYDESSDEACKVHFAHNLRMRLWAEHLNMGMGSVFDPIGSAAHWASPPASARVGVFDQNADTDRRCPRTPANCATENMAEPDGS